MLTYGRWRRCHEALAVVHDRDLNEVEHVHGGYARSKWVGERRVPSADVC